MLRSSTASQTPLAPTKPYLVIAIIVLLGACFSQRAGAQISTTVEKSNVIRGVVINSVTREPVGRALVVSSDNRYATFTDEQGQFEFAILSQEADSAIVSFAEANASGVTSFRPSSGPMLPYSLMARKPGFLGLEQANVVSVVPGKDVTIELVPEARIVGRVLLPNSTVAGGLGVELCRRQVYQGRAYWISAGNVRVRGNGEFRFADLQPGAYRFFTGELPDRDPLTFDPKGPQYGYPPAYFSNSTDFQSATTTQLSPGMTFQAELTPVRQPYYPVKVPISDAPAGEQIDVHVSVQGRSGPGFTLGYDGSAHAIEGSLPNGNYVIEASTYGPSYRFGSIRLAVKGGPAEGAPLTMTAKTSLRIKVKLEFTGNTETEDMESHTSYSGFPPSANLGRFVNVRLEPADEFGVLSSPNFAPEISASEDVAVFQSVAPGRYWIKIDCSRGYVAALTAGDVDLLRHPLTVGLGSTLVVDATVRDDGAEISGTVEGIQNSEIPRAAPRVLGTMDLENQRGAYVYLIPLPNSAGQFRYSPVGTDGKFVFRTVAPGSYRALAFERMPVDLEYTKGEALSAYESQGEVVRVTTGQKETVKLRAISASE